MKAIFLLLYGCMVGSIVYSQSCNHIILNKNNDELTFDAMDRLQPINEIAPKPFVFCMFNYNAISYDNGNLALFNVGSNIYNSAGQLILGTQTVKATIGTIPKSTLLKFDTNKFILFGWDHCYYGQSNNAFTFSIIEPDANANGGFKVLLTDTLPVYNYRNAGFGSWSYSRDLNGLIDVIYQDTSKVLLYHINAQGKSQLMDSMDYRLSSIIQPPFNQKIPFVKVLSGRNTMGFNNGGNKFLLNEHYRVDDMYNKNNLLSYAQFTEIEIDKKFKKFVGVKPVFINARNNNGKVDDFTYYVEQACYSPDDTKLYFNSRQSDSFPFKKDFTFTTVSQVDLNSRVVKEMSRSNFISKHMSGENIWAFREQTLFLSPNGALYYNHADTIEKNGVAYVKSDFNRLNNADDVFNNTNLQTNALSVEYKLSDAFLGWIKTPMFDYLRFKTPITYTCDAKVTFANNSLSQINFSKYKWHIATDTGMFYFEGLVPPTLTYTKNGKYAFKIFGYSEKGGGYGEWYTDSLDIQIPNPPISTFTATPLQICAYNPVTFNNTSNQGQINPSTGVSYLWAFGDGDTSQTAFPKHSYTKAGVYDVSLITNNGYCADTLIKKQYITVVDAPKPGMVLAPTEGCTPFAVAVQELNTNPVQSRTYDMGNGEMLNPTSANFSYVYTTPGNFTITQTLSSASGCAATSTQLVKVHQGFAATDSAHLYNGSYLNNQTIELQWLPVAAAAGYAIFEGNTKIQETNAATLSINLPITEPKTLVYSIKAIDSCGNYSSAGLVSAPMLLQHHQEGNAVIHLNHSSYYNWSVPIVKYEIEYTYSSAMQFLGNTLNNQYDDKDFAPQQISGLSDTQKCYRIKAYSADGRVSTSNVVCAAMLPMVFMPTAFTPNANGINDVYTPSLLGISRYELLVYNRWGQLIAQTNNQGWQATNVPEGVYNVLFFGKSVSGRQVNVNVAVTLLR